MAPEMKQPGGGSGSESTEEGSGPGARAATTSGRQGRVYERVKEHQKEGVYRRLKEVREATGWGLRKTTRTARSPVVGTVGATCTNSETFGGFENRGAGARQPSEVAVGS